MAREEKSFPEWPVTRQFIFAMEQKRRDLGISQEKMAEKVRALGITCTQAAISNLVAGKTKSSPLVEPICTALGLNLLELVAMDERQMKVLRALAAVAEQAPDKLDEFVEDIEARRKWLAPKPSSPAKPGPVKSRGSTDE